jgi:hypothetical protein
MFLKMLMFNSANFKYANIDLSKEIYFVGDNVAGKTTTTRAIHFQYNANGENLGIPSDKDTFLKHYFPYDNSYIIYVHDSFFIFTYKRSGSIQRYFVKGRFDESRITNSGNLLDFEDIRDNYIKKATLFKKPNTVKEYLDIFYGHDNKFLDFSTGYIKDYNIFISMFNMIFNIDKAIVGAIDIKKAIQKSLDRDDAILSIDYDDFIRKLQSFAANYHFFKEFDSIRNLIQPSVDLKDELIELEKKQRYYHKVMSYRYPLEKEQINKIEIRKDEIKKESERLEKRKRRNNLRLESFNKRIAKKIDDARVDIRSVEKDKGKYTVESFEEKSELIANEPSVKGEFENVISLLSDTKRNIGSKADSIKSEIKSIEFNIENTIPNSMVNLLQEKKSAERDIYNNEISEINEEFQEQEKQLSKKHESLEEKITNYKNSLEKINKKIELEKSEIEGKYIRFNKEFNIERSELIKVESRLSGEMRFIDKGVRTATNTLEDHNMKFRELRKEHFKNLKIEIKKYKSSIGYYQEILDTTEGSFKEYLINEWEGWEEILYPVLDENILNQPISKLAPVKIDNTALLLGFSFSSKELKQIPTQTEAMNAISELKVQMVRNWRNAREIRGQRLEVLNEEQIDLESNLSILEHQKKIKNDEIIENQKSIEEINKKITDLPNKKNNEQLKVEESYKQEIDKLIEKKESALSELNDLVNVSIPAFKRDWKSEVNSSKKRFESNCKTRRKEVDKIKEIKIKEENFKIENLNKQMNNLDKEGLIQRYQTKIKELEKKQELITLAKEYVKNYKLFQVELSELPEKKAYLDSVTLMFEKKGKVVGKINSVLISRKDLLQKEKDEIEVSSKEFSDGIKLFEDLKIDVLEKSIESNNTLKESCTSFRKTNDNYNTKRISLKTNLSKIKRIDNVSIIDINLNISKYDEVESIGELKEVIESLKELLIFEQVKYQGEKKRKHKQFMNFLGESVSQKISLFGKLEDEFNKKRKDINKNLKTANFGVIKDIVLEVEIDESKSDTVAVLLEKLRAKVKDTINIFGKDSLFYQDNLKSAQNIEDIQNILMDIKKRGAKGAINLFDTIDLSISYTENGKRQNKPNINHDSSSGGNIMLKVAIAISILNLYIKMEREKSPFFLIVDEVSKLQNKNQNLLQSYINNNGFKTLFITPDPAYPDPERAIYYTFKNIQEEGESLEIRQMNVV